MIKKGDIVKCDTLKRKPRQSIGVVQRIIRKNGNKIADVEIPANFNEYNVGISSYTFCVLVGHCEKLSDEKAMLWKLENL
jgi:hypothetical protein